MGRRDDFFCASAAAPSTHFMVFVVFLVMVMRCFRCPSLLAGRVCETRYHSTQ
jgi:hypothetical protein